MAVATWLKVVMLAASAMVIDSMSTEKNYPIEMAELRELKQDFKAMSDTVKVIKLEAKKN